MCPSCAVVSCVVTFYQWEVMNVGGKYVSILFKYKMKKKKKTDFMQTVNSANSDSQLSCN